MPPAGRIRRPPLPDDRYRPAGAWLYTESKDRTRHSVVPLHAKPTRGRWLPRWALLGWALMTAGAPPAAAAPGDARTWGGNLAVTSDFIYRGLSESSGDPALQADLHADTSGGTFGGVWASTRDHSLDPYAGYDLEIYLGLRLDLGNAWSTSFRGRRSGL